MKKLIYLLSIISLFSCDSKIGAIPENSKVYYKFNSNDFDRIPTRYSQIGNVSIYKNAGGQGIEIKNISYTLYENNYLNGQIFGTEYYYDDLWIQLKIQGTLTFDLSINIGTIKDVLGYQIRSGQVNNYNFPVDNNLLISRTINNTLYTKIIVFELDNLAIININNVRINKIYFDLKGGFVGLEDTVNNNQFWLTN